MAHDADVLRGLADEIKEVIAEIKSGSTMRQVAVTALGLLILGKKDLVLAALRAPQGDGAGAMREAAVGVVRYRGERARMALAGGLEGRAINRAIREACANMASEIEALPLAQPDTRQEPGTEGKRS